MPASLRLVAFVIGTVCALVALAAVLRSAGGSAASAGCPRTAGGGTGGASQVRFLDARDDHATFTFGQSASGMFESPGFSVEQTGTAGHERVFRVRFDGASTVNPNGTPSFEGLPMLQPDDRILREVRFIEDGGGGSTWEVMAADAACPRVTVKRYAEGSFPRAQVILSFGNPSSITLEPNPPLGPQLWVSGAGFTPSSTVDIALGGTDVAQAPTAPDGTFEKGLYVFDLEPGLYRVGASDRQGHAASNQLTVPRLPLVPDIVPRR